MGDNEIDRPAHKVTVSPFCIDKTEVTVAAYRACVAAHKCKPPSAIVEWQGITSEDRTKWSQFCTWGKRGLDQHPLNCVDWHQATAYCASTGGRLPTEAEWEYAARGSDRRNFPWGTEQPDVTRLNACGGECASMARERLHEHWQTMYSGDDGWPATAPVGNYPKGASPFGVLDMAGNVWEWTADIYTVGGGDPAMNPPAHRPDIQYRAIRGGSWNSNTPARIRAAFVDGNQPDSRNFSVGFRCAREAKM
jgi:formylglycine-generating enzyme required for sulfatase activity